MFNIREGAGATALDIQQQIDARRGWAVIEQPEISTTTGMEITIDGGEYLTVNETHSPALTTLTLNEGDPDQPRRDVIYGTASGTIEVVRGIPNPKYPSGATRWEAWSPWPRSMWNTDGTVLAEVWVDAGTTSLVDADIRERGFDAEIVRHSVTAKRMKVENPPEEETDVARLADLNNSTAISPLQSDLDADGYDITNIGTVDASEGYVTNVPNDLRAVVNRELLDSYYRLSGDRLRGEMNADGNNISNASEVDADRVLAGETLQIPVYEHDNHDSDIWFRSDL